MKPALEHLPIEDGSSFVVKDFDYNYYPTPWHYHPEYEIVLVTESTGKRYIGDHISDFKPGDMCFLGPHIPHTYKNDERYYESDSSLRAKSIVIHFTGELIQNHLNGLPEARKIKDLLAMAENGFELYGDLRENLAGKMKYITHVSGFERWLCLLGILNEMAESNEKTPITKTAQMGMNEKENDRLCKIFDWVTANFQSDITLGEAAAIAEMNENAFSRFFSMRTRKTFSGFVQELRLKKAATLLRENTLSVSDICYECGYNNVSNFNRQFLRLYNLSPLKYRQAYLKNMVAGKMD